MGVTYGFGGREEILESDPDVIAASVDEIIPILTEQRWW